MKKNLVVLSVAVLLVAPGRLLAGQTGKAGDEAGYKLLSDLVLLLDKGGRGAADATALNAGVVELARELKTARESKRVEPLFAVRYSRLLSAIRQGLSSDPELLYWPMYRHAMIDFIEERTGRMPDLDKLSFVVNDHGGSGVGLAMLAEAIMSEVVSLHIHLETLDRRQAILQSYLEGTMKPRDPGR